MPSGERERERECKRDRAIRVATEQGSTLSRTGFEELTAAKIALVAMIVTRSIDKLASDGSTTDKDRRDEFLRMPEVSCLLSRALSHPIELALKLHYLVRASSSLTRTYHPVFRLQHLAVFRSWRFSHKNNRASRNLGRRLFFFLFKCNVSRVVGIVTRE